jgi:DNA-binding LytR/AlgR family response regulator
MKAIIVDDEPKAIELIKSYLQHFKQVELVSTFRNGLKAFEFLNSNDIDLIFLDINMPHISGISLSKMIDKDVKIIFTTAYSEYAAESYEVAAIDYLLKPVTLERFMLAMGKLMNSGMDTISKKQSFLWIKSGNKTYKLSVDEILYLKKDGNYITYYTGESEIIARESISDALARLPQNFCRVHKSYIINAHEITAYDRDSIFISENIIPIGISYKQDLKSILTSIEMKE